MDTNTILFIAFVMYTIGLLIAIKFDLFYLLFVSILWLVPVFLVDNEIIVLFSVIMLILHVVISIYSKKGGNDFE
jgi:hypothetical protein